MFSVTSGSPFVVRDRKPVRQWGEASRKVVAAPPTPITAEESSDSVEDDSDNEVSSEKQPSKLSTPRVSLKPAVVTKKKDVSWTAVDRVRLVATVYRVYFISKVYHCFYRLKLLTK